MSHVFISYVKEDKAAAQTIAEALRRAGFPAWWDRDIPPGKTWDEVIGSALDSAGCVLVLWSKTSVRSRWVKEEAERGASRNCLVPVLLEDVEPPFGFSRIQAADLSKWRGDDDAPEFAGLLRAVSALIQTGPGGPAAGQGSGERVKRRPQRRRSLIIGLISAGVIAAAAAGYWASTLPRTDATAAAKAEEHGARGEAKYRDKRYDEAIQEFDEAIRLDPSKGDWYNWRGLAYSEKGMHERALQDYSRAIDYNPNLAIAYSNRGWARSSLGRPEEALADLNRAIELNPRLTQAYENRGIAYANINSWERAIADFSTVISIDPSAKVSYNGRGYARRELKFSEEALADLTKAIELDPRFRIAYENRAMTYENLNDWNRAIADWTAAIEIAPTKAQFERRAKAKLAISDEAGANADMQRAAELAGRTQ